MRSVVAALALAQPTCSLSFSENESHFTRHGHVLMRSLLSDIEVGTARVALDVNFPRFARDAFVTEGRSELQVAFNIRPADPLLQQIAFHPALVDVARRLVGRDHLCLWMDRVFYKEPGADATHWHRDDESIDLQNLGVVHTVATWIPLEHMSEQLGTIRYLSGSQVPNSQLPWWQQAIAAVLGWDLTLYTLLPMVIESDLSPGDVSWHHGWLVHSAGANRGSRVRKAYSTTYAYCDDVADDRCAWVNETDPTCRAAAAFFGPEWDGQSGRGRSELVKTDLRSFWDKAGALVVRTVVGAALGLGVYSLASWVAGLRGAGKQE
mmetsp:Transcript_87398/g.199643  ORF Transcript_87398/g.199643 Transcript_87398/m.199643 type:complete len:322 (+) Transcript_87398:12-977(+)